MKFSYKTAASLQEYSVTQGIGASQGDQKVIAKDIPCQAACPARTNVPLYIEHLAQGDARTSYQVNLEDNVFPGVLGRVCTRPCEERCRHQWTNVNGPVSICHLKRAAADKIAGTIDPPAPYFTKTGKRIAIIGGGPAGLTAAREGRRLGHDITLYEREDRLGGMMINGIPRFRLPAEIVEQEIRLITDTGISVHTGVNVDAAKIQALIDEYDAVCVAAGTMKINSLDIPGLPPELAISGLQFMHQYNHDAITQMKGDVVVIGGGFTAVDCSRSSARVARRLLGEGDRVSIIYRRTEEFMAAQPEELEEIERENIDIRTLATPIGVTVKDGQLQSVRFTRNMLASGTEGGKPKIVPVSDSAFDIPCQNLIIAIGQTQEFDILPAGLTLTKGFNTTVDKVFAAGDFATGSDNVIKAVANGKAVAREIDAFLMGADRLQDVVKIEILNNDGDTGRVRDHDILAPVAMPVASIDKRAQDNHEVESGFTPESTCTNAQRCYLCHYKFEIDQDKCIHCDWCIQAAPRECIKRLSRVFLDDDGCVDTVVEANLAHEGTYIWIDSDECIRCGKCLRVCPTGAISMSKAERIVTKARD